MFASPPSPCRAPSPAAGPSRRRRRLGCVALPAALLVAGLLVVADAVLLEPRWLAVRHVRLATGPDSVRLVHISDIHYRGDRAGLERAVARMRAEKPDFVCFTGDLADSTALRREALDILATLGLPLFGVSGNHDWGEPLATASQPCLARTGGAWLDGTTARTADGRVELVGSEGRLVPAEMDRLEAAGGEPRTTRWRLLLCHYPVVVDVLHRARFDLVLAGHSHGGQVRLPGYGALLLPYGVGRYQRGLHQTPVGPLYVNPGLGWFLVPARFACRPEVTVIDL